MYLARDINKQKGDEFQKVAIKVIKQKEQEEQVEDFEKEIF